MTPFEASRSEQEVFDDLDILCGSSGYIHVLAYLSLRDDLISYDGYMTSEDMAASYAPERTIRTGLLGELHACLNQHMYEELRRKVAAQQAGLPVDESSSLFQRADVLREPIFYGGESA